MPNLVVRAISQIASWFQSQRTYLMGGTWNIGTKEVYPDINATTAITAGFDANTAVYAIIKRDAKKFGAIPRYLYSTATNEEKALRARGLMSPRTALYHRGQFGEMKAKIPDTFDSPALTALLNRPNEYQGQDAFLALVRAFYKCCGESFVWLNRGDTDMLMGDDLVSLSDEQQRRKPVLEMYVLPANMMIVVPDPDNVFGVYGYILQSMVRVPIRKTDIIHWKDLNLRFDVASKPHLRGMSPLVPGAKTLEQNNSATNSSVRMYQNDGAKGALANKSMAKMSPTQETQLRQVIDTKVNNNDVKGAVAALQGEWTYLDIAKSSVDMELLKGKQLSMQELCFLFGMPYEFFDSQTTYANKEVAQKSWISNEILSDCKQFDGELNRMLLPAFGLDTKAFIGSDTTELPELQKDMNGLATYLNVSWWITPNEKREMMNQEPIVDPELDEVWVPAGITPLSQVMDPAEQVMQQIALEQAASGNNSSNGINGQSNNGNGKTAVSKGR